MNYARSVRHRFPPFPCSLNLPRPDARGCRKVRRLRRPELSRIRATAFSYNSTPGSQRFDSEPLNAHGTKTISHSGNSVKSRRPKLIASPAPPFGRTLQVISMEGFFGKAPGTAAEAEEPFMVQMRIHPEIAASLHVGLPGRNKYMFFHLSVRNSSEDKFRP